MINSEFEQEEEFARGLEDGEDFNSQRQGKYSSRGRQQQETEQPEAQWFV